MRGNERNKTMHFCVESKTAKKKAKKKKKATWVM